MQSQVVAAGALHTDDVPVLDDLHFMRGKHRGERLARARIAGIGGRAADPDADPVRALAAAGKAPLAADHEAAGDPCGRLQRIEAAGEHLVRAGGVNVLLRFDRQRGEIGVRRAERGDPGG